MQQLNVDALSAWARVREAARRAGMPPGRADDEAHWIADRIADAVAVVASPQPERIALAGPPDEWPPLSQILSPRETHVFRMLANGETNESIASLLRLSVRTVETHRARVFHKLDIHCLADLIRYALVRGIL